MQQLVECVPNFSNGRDPEVYNAIAEVIEAAPGVTLLDVSADADHNRTVITFAGTAAAVEEAAFQAIKMAAERIDLDMHEGAHPRLGATDVCPFIPIKGVSMADCVTLAKRLGERVGNELGIAVYLYGEAATRPEREKLADIRKGEYELWRDEIGKVASREPDFGPAEPKSWGATVIGARPFLIAYNLFLNSDDVEVAERIARSVRYSSGGLRHVQAKGFLVEGQAQVSMNLTNFYKTPIHRVQEFVRREAEHYGLVITRAELIGLTPQQALTDAARWYLQLDEMNESQILENSLSENGGESTAPDAFIEAAAAATPTPGGGSVAALVGSLAAALTQMVAGLTVGRKRYAEASDEAEAIRLKADQIKRRLKDCIDEDAAAFEAVLDVYRNKELSADDKAAALERATVGAARVPLEVAELSLETAELAARIADIGNVNASTDAAVAALMAQSAVRGTVLNVRVNANELRDKTLAASMHEEASDLESRVAAVTDQALAAAARRGGY